MGLPDLASKSRSCCAKSEMEEAPIFLDNGLAYEFESYKVWVKKAMTLPQSLGDHLKTGQLRTLIQMLLQLLLTGSIPAYALDVGAMVVGVVERLVVERQRASWGASA